MYVWSLSGVIPAASSHRYVGSDWARLVHEEIFEKITTYLKDAHSSLEEEDCLFALGIVGEAGRLECTAIVLVSSESPRRTEPGTTCSKFHASPTRAVKYMLSLVLDASHSIRVTSQNSSFVSSSLIQYCFNQPTLLITGRLDYRIHVVKRISQAGVREQRCDILVVTTAIAVFLVSSVAVVGPQS